MEMTQAGAAEPQRREQPLLTLRRGVPIIVGTTVVCVALAIGLSLTQKPRYEASADVFVTPSVDTSIAGVPVLSNDPARIVATQAEVARIPRVAEIAAESVDSPDASAGELLDNSAVIADAGTDILTFEVTWDDEDLARELTNAYARGYARYRSRIETGALKKAQSEIDVRLEQVANVAGRNSPEVANLLEESQQLRTVEVLRGSSTSIGRPAAGAAQTQPRPVRNGLIGGILGLILGVSLVFVRDALNTRLRTAQEVEERLGMPLIGRIPPPPRRLAEDKLISVEDPTAPEAETYRMLATNIEVLNLDRGASSFLITSAIHEEGKSTTAANLAVAFARRGTRVILMEADVRRPRARRFFGLEDHGPGLADAALGRVDLDNALASIEIAGEQGALAEESGGAPWRLEVLAGDPAPPSPADFLKTQVVADLVAALQDRCDLLLIDTPPLLHVSDALSLALSAKVDCVIAAARLGVVRRQMADELRRILGGFPAVKLGFFATGEEARAGYGGGYDYYYYGNGRRRPVLARGARRLTKRTSGD